ncbi:MAG: Kelch repeat-containing protein, partial [Candidatus Polarisedimenticolia bacterium]
MIPLFLALGLLSTSLQVRASSVELTFEQRVAAQRAIEQVYYTHQIDRTRPFDEAAPGELIERKVRDYLLLSAALEQRWGEPITAPMLREETRRIAQSTPMPDRLAEIYAALGNDPVLVLECLARPALAGRLARARFHADTGLQTSAREEAAALHSRLLDGSLGLDDEDPRRVVLDSRATEGASSIEPSQLRERKLHAPGRARQVGDVTDRDDRFEISVVLEESPDRTRLALYTVPKSSWESWWREAAETFDAARVTTVATASDVLPGPQGTEPRVSPLIGGCPVNDVWNTGGALAARAGSTAVWTGSRMIVWGGGLNTGVQYDPVTDTSTPTTTTGAPSARTDHSAVWTGTHMIVWGGSGSNSILGTGASYDPVADTWSALSTSFAPSPRAGHTAVWTGSRMVVWGGYTGSSFLNTGGRYDPQSDHWSPTNTVQAPEGRLGHTAVWGGGRMIVWGGRLGSGTTTTATGAQYDPTGDTWSVTSSGSAPSARIGHTAVWTGSHMIVWGGYAAVNGTRLNTGALYDPSANTWTAVSLANAPAPRGDHTVLWTGARMIVWGGDETGAGPAGTGGLFEPVGNTWAPVATTAAPSGHGRHAAAWTGNRMIIWGGGFLPGDLHALYDPATDTWTTSPYQPRIPAPTAVWTGTLMIVAKRVPPISSSP